jgi:trans-2,3-dihydro-3-hydroxyanthranilate isomerase
MSHQFHIVDVFAEQVYEGNPLAVVVGEHFLSDVQMQKIAAEINFSETTFVISSPEEDGGYRMRIFTPAREIAFTGHPLLGTAWVINEFLAAGRETAIQWQRGGLV